MAGLLSDILYALGRKTDQNASKELVSKFVPGYNPPSKPLRPFEADYPKGALADEQGRLLKTIDGHDIRGKIVVGRTMVGGTDEALSPAQFDAITKAVTGRSAEVVAQSSLGSDVGRTAVNRYSRLPLAVTLSRDLSPNQFERAYAHELGHVIDQAAGEMPIRGIRRQAEQVYNTLNTGTERTRNLTGPEHMGYRGEEIPRELMAEGIRAYATDPNYIKTVAPDFAKRIRETVNTDPALSKIIQFNSLAPIGLLGAGYAMAPSDAEAAPKVPKPRLHGPSMTDAVMAALPEQTPQHRPDWIGENGAITQNPPWLRPDPNERSTIGKLWDAATSNPTGFAKTVAGSLGDMAKDYARSVWNDPSKGAADALELGVTSLGGAIPQAIWMAGAPDEANAGEEAILEQRRKQVTGLLN